MASHLASLWNRGLRQLGNRLVFDLTPIPGAVLHLKKWHKRNPGMQLSTTKSRWLRLRRSFRQPASSCHLEDVYSMSINPFAANVIERTVYNQIYNIYSISSKLLGLQSVHPMKVELLILIKVTSGLVDWLYSRIRIYGINSFILLELFWLI